jgi:putative acetyltransferase
LIREGRALLRRQQATGCVVMGDTDFYMKFGFRHDPQVTLQDCAPQYFLTQPLSSIEGSGIVQHSAAFYGGVDGQTERHDR